MVWLEKVAQRITATRTLFCLGFLIVLHFIVMLNYMHDARMIHQRARRNVTIQKIVNIIHLVEATSAVNREEALKAEPDPIVQSKITSEPLYPLQFEGVSWWEINQALRKQEGEFSVSIQLLPNQWLNVRATVYAFFLSNQLLLMAIEGFAVGLLFLAALMINSYTRPLKSFEEAARSVRDASTELPEKIGGPAAVQQVVDAVIRMRERIARQAEDRTKMLAAISHDLRTPITRMTLRAQLLPDQETQEALLNDLREMEQMVNETLAFARADAAQKSSQKFDLVSLIESICNGQRDMGFSVNFISSVRRIPFEGKSLALKRAFANLITNGCRYGENIEVSCALLSNTISITVKDDGPGIPEEDLDNVFQPFYRSCQSRSRDSGGVGLGLAVTRDFISLHGGRVFLSNHESGLLATVELPFSEKSKDT